MAPDSGHLDQPECRVTDCQPRVAVGAGDAGGIRAKPDVEDHIRPVREKRAGDQGAYQAGVEPAAPARPVAGATAGSGPRRSRVDGAWQPAVPHERGDDGGDRLVCDHLCPSGEPERRHEKANVP